MSKRNRTSRRPSGRSTARPGRSGRPAGRPSGPAPTGPASAALEAATIASGEALATSVDQPDGEVQRQARSRSHARPSGLLAKRAEDEYVYVAQDIRHIAMVLGLVFVIFVVLWVLIEVAHVIRY